MRCRGIGWMPDGSGVSATDGVFEGDGNGYLQRVVSIPRDSETTDTFEHGDDEGVAMSSKRFVKLWLRARGDGGRQRGAAIVEQALILPVLLAVMFGAIDMSRALYTYHYVSYAAREATRWASVRSGPLNGGPVDQADIQTFVSNVSGMGLDPARITSSASWVAPPNRTPLCPGGLANSALNNKPGCVVQVTVNYNYKFIFPFLPNGTFRMSSESQMIITQ